MDSIRVLVRVMEEDALVELAERTKKSKNETAKSDTYLWVISFFVFLIFIFFYYVLQSNSAKLTRFNVALHNTIQELNATNEELQASQETLLSNMDRLMFLQEELRKSETNYRLISTNSKDLISLYDAGDNPTRIFISPSCIEIMGYEPSEMIGRSPYDFILPEDAARMQMSTQPDTLSGRSATVEYRGKRKDGTIIWLESISNPFFDEDGTVIGFQTSARDITQRKVYEEKIIQAKEESEQVSEKLRTLLGEKNDLIGLFSHDMRAPINQVKGIAHIMTSFLDDKETLKECIFKLNHTVNRQLALYKDVLFMLKSDQVSFDANFLKRTTLKGIVEKACQNLDLEIKNKKLNVTVDILETLDVSIEPDLFVQAIQNLLSNAIKFSNTEGLIEIAAYTREQQVFINLRDQGIGFEPSKAELLFERFTKEGRKGTNNEESTGLGLYLVRKIIENHKGIITARSEGENRGSLFVIVLPL